MLAEETREKKYWVIVASKDHVDFGRAGGFVMANHGKAAPLKRMQKGDGVVFYAPKLVYGEPEPCQAFVALAQICDDEIYQRKMSADFVPYRRNAKFFKTKSVPIEPLIESLTFIENKKSWGYKFRFGFFEIPQSDFNLIAKKMK